VEYGSNEGNIYIQSQGVRLQTWVQDSRCSYVVFPASTLSLTPWGARLGQQQHFLLKELQCTDNETGPSSKWNYTSNELVFDAEYAALWVAIGSIIVSLFASMSLLWGFWHLNRKVSLSPVETARALAETVLDSPSGNRDMTIAQMLELFGDRPTR
jgi:hypothetical protein